MGRYRFEGPLSKFNEAYSARTRYESGKSKDLTVETGGGRVLVRCSDTTSGVYAGLALSDDFRLTEIVHDDE